MTLIKTKLCTSTLKILSLLGFVVLVSGCIVLRSQMDPNTSANPHKFRKKPTKVSKLEKENAQLQLKIKNYDEQFRTLLGRIEDLESSASEEQENSGAQKKVKDLELALSQMVTEQEKLKKKLNSLQSDSSSKPQKSEVSGDLNMADRYFSTGKWSKAIKEFQKFRELNPKSPEVPIATYKIGVCFQELDMVPEAKTFYNSVIRKYPQDRAAKFAKFRLDNL